MNPILLQKQLKNNAADLNDFYEDLKSWGKDMEKREELSAKSTNDNLLTGEKEGINLSKRKKKDQKQKPIEPAAKLGYTDYSAWDKFDVDAECEKIDYNNENDESELSDECDNIVKDEAYLQKEKGNKYVKCKKWDEAIECYNKAIEIYSYDPVFYANRGLCFLKKENYVEAELDCTRSIRLDGTYVKAYQRRAAAREALNKLAEAEADLLKVLELEPKNTESLNNLEMLQKKLQLKTKDSYQRPLSKFALSRNKKYSDKTECSSEKHSHGTTADGGRNERVDRLEIDTDAVIPVKAIVKPVHLQSKKPLNRINIEEIVEHTNIIGNVHESVLKA